MKIQLLRDWFNPDTGRIIEKGKLIDVTRWRGNWLISKRIGREENESIPEITESTKDKLKKEVEETPEEGPKRPRKPKQEEN